MGQPIVRYESGQTSYAFDEADDSGDQTTFTAPFSPISRVSGYAPVVAPYGLKTGGAITVGSGNDNVAVAAMTLVAPGMTGANADGVVSVAADTTVAVSRGVSSDTHMITSITVDATGAITPVAGTDSTAFSETRGAAGGPPFIPVGSIEIGQVRTTSVTAAPVTAAEIFVVPGLHRERSDYPVYDLDYATGEITFVDALPEIHTGSLPKKVYIKGATPLFAPIPKSSNWVPAEATYSISSTDTYDGPVGSSASSLGQASFSAVLTDGITDNFVSLKGQNLWFEFRPDRDVSVPKQLTQGIFGISRSFPAGGGSVSATCTVTPTDATVDVAS
jgi:hypothetical protein